MKFWLITLKGADERQRLMAFARRKDAVSKLTELKEEMDKHLRHTNVQLEKVGNLLVIAGYGDGDDSIRFEEAVMTELPVIEPGNTDYSETIGISEVDWEDVSYDSEAEKKNDLGF
jgi:hypothetical protein